MDQLPPARAPPSSPQPGQGPPRNGSATSCWDLLPCSCPPGPAPRPWPGVRPLRGGLPEDSAPASSPLSTHPPPGLPLSLPPRALPTHLLQHHRARGWLRTTGGHQGAPSSGCQVWVHATPELGAGRGGGPPGEDKPDLWLAPLGFLGPVPGGCCEPTAQTRKLRPEKGWRPPWLSGCTVWAWLCGFWKVT